MKSYGEGEVLRNIDLEVSEGEILTVLGSSGCGKSTLLKIFAGILFPEKGKVWLDGKDITHLPTGKRNIIMVHQDLLLFPHMNVYENIAYGLKARRRGKKEINTAVEELLIMTELEGYGNKNVNDLSGGEKQRVALARSIAAEPHIILLDEPFSGLDTPLRRKIRQFTAELVRKKGITTILVTHDREEAFTMSDKIALMEDGEILKCEDPITLMTDPGDRKTSEFLGFENIMEKYNIPVDAVEAIPDKKGEYVIISDSFTGRARTVILRSQISGETLTSEMPVDFPGRINTACRIRIDKNKIIPLSENKPEV